MFISFIVFYKDICFASLFHFLDAFPVKAKGYQSNIYYFTAVYIIFVHVLTYFILTANNK